MHRNASYELFEELGRGDQTVVYRAYDLSLGREVAIKQLQEEHRDHPGRRAQFLQEARFLAQFEHDHILRVYSVDEQAGWIVMERMHDTLATLIAGGPCDPNLVRSILQQTLTALEFLHQRNKVHGTVRPSNLLINEQGRVKLSEFEQLDPDGELRAPTGSKKYLAPELIQPDFGPFATTADLYCLGFTALELLKGPRFDSLFPGTGAGAIDADIAWMRWHSAPEQLAPISQLVKNLPEDLAGVLDAMLRKRVADRPQSAQAVLDDLVNRPLLSVPVTDSELDSNQHRSNDPVPTRVREVAPMVKAQFESTASATVTPPGTSTIRKAKAKPRQASRPFSRVWVNQKLSNPFVLCSLCVTISLAAVGMGLAPSAVRPANRPEQPVSLEHANTSIVTITPQPAAEESPDPPTAQVVTERKAPELPSEFVAAPEAEFDPLLNLPTRIRVRKLDRTAPLELVLIKPGSYRMGVFSDDRFSWEQSGTNVELLQPIYIAATETTNRQYGAFFVDSGESKAGRSWLITAQKYSQAKGLPTVENELPVTNVSIDEAEQFCKWIGCRLPSEMEWECAARGPGDHGFPYPWRGPLDSRRCQIFRGGEPAPVPVTDLADGRSSLQLSHLLGNAAEWCTYHDDNAAARITTGEWDKYVTKGCSFATARRDHVRVSWRGNGKDSGEWDIGFRACVAIADTK